MWRGGAQQWRHGPAACDSPAGVAGALLALLLPLRSQGAGTKGAPRPTFALSLHQTSLISLVGPPAGWPRTCSRCRALCCCCSGRCCICVVFAFLSLFICTRPASHIPSGRLTAWPPPHLRLVLAASTTNRRADRPSLPSPAPLVYYHAYRFSCTCTHLRQPLRLPPSLFFYRLWTVDTDTTLANGCQPPPSHVRRRPR